MDTPVKRDTIQSPEKRGTIQLPIKRASSNLPGKRGASELLMKREIVKILPLGSADLPTELGTVQFPVKRGIVTFPGKLRTRGTSEVPMKRGNGVILDTRKVRARSLEYRNPIQGFSGFWKVLMNRAFKEREIILGLW
jgi:hypothetical protein